MDKNKNYIRLKDFSGRLGADLFGVADISAIKDEFAISKSIVEKVDRAIVLGVRLSQAVLSEISLAPTRLYSHHYRTVNAFLDQAALKVTNFIQDQGFLSLPIPASQIVDWDKQTAHLSHKKLGVLAGLGWIGRNNLLVNKRFGSQFRLASILTNMPLKADKPAKLGCGQCRACILVCPAQAIKEEAAAFDHRQCFAKLKEFQKQHIVEQYICGVCIQACQAKTARGIPKS
jgi:epoxyqueuosine reductase